MQMQALQRPCAKQACDKHGCPCDKHVYSHCGATVAHDKLLSLPVCLCCCRVVITQMQALHRHKQGMSTVAVARQVYRDHGVTGFFKGLMPSMVMVINPTIQVGLCARTVEKSKARSKEMSATAFVSGT